MTKTIEEAAEEFVAEFYQLEEYGDEVSDVEIDNSQECFEAYILSLPLASRLTEKEKERVRKEYANIYPHDPDCGVANILIKGVLERIFGKELFEEG